MLTKKLPKRFFFFRFLFFICQLFLFANKNDKNCIRTPKLSYGVLDIITVCFYANSNIVLRDYCTVSTKKCYCAIQCLPQNGPRNTVLSCPSCSIRRGIISFFLAPGQGLHDAHPPHRGAAARRELCPRGLRRCLGGLLHCQSSRGCVRSPVPTHEVRAVKRDGGRWSLQVILVRIGYITRTVFFFIFMFSHF